MKNLNFKELIEVADTLDADEIIEVARTPGFKFQGFGYESQLGGLETWGVRSYITTPVTFSFIRDCESDTKDIEFATDR